MRPRPAPTGSRVPAADPHLPHRAPGPRAPRGRSAGTSRARGGDRSTTRWPPGTSRATHCAERARHEAPLVQREARVVVRRRAMTTVEVAGLSKRASASKTPARTKRSSPGVPLRLRHPRTCSSAHREARTSGRGRGAETARIREQIEHARVRGGSHPAARLALVEEHTRRGRRRGALERQAVLRTTIASFGVARHAPEVAELLVAAGVDEHVRLLRRTWRRRPRSRALRVRRRPRPREPPPAVDELRDEPSHTSTARPGNPSPCTFTGETRSSAQARARAAPARSAPASRPRDRTRVDIGERSTVAAPKPVVEDARRSAMARATRHCAMAEREAPRVQQQPWSGTRPPGAAP